MSYINERLLTLTQNRRDADEMDGMVLAYIKCLDKIGVCGIDRDDHFESVISFLAKNKIPHNFNVKKHLIWLTAVVSQQLADSFLHDWSAMSVQPRTKLKEKQ